MPLRPIRRSAPIRRLFPSLLKLKVKTHLLLVDELGRAGHGGSFALAGPDPVDNGQATLTRYFEEALAGAGAGLDRRGPVERLPTLDQSAGMAMPNPGQ